MKSARSSCLPRLPCLLPRLLPGVAVGALLLPAICLGALGENEASVDADSIQFQASHVLRPTQAYVVHELATPGGITVREFVAADGVVFAVSWQGPLLPDLRTLLGRHFDSPQAAVRPRSAAHSELLIDTPELVIHSEGRLRAFSGQAYLPQLVPAGVAVTELH